MLDEIIENHTKYYCPNGCKTEAGLRVEVIRKEGSKFLKTIEKCWPTPKSYLNRERSFKLVREVLLKM